MSRGAAGTQPSFGEFFAAIHGREPFPWQARLAEEVLAKGWPRLLDLPTGAGKTSALDVALYALAMAPERMPRRTVLVVDRRIVVDQGAELARKLRRELTRSVAPAAVAIARRLRSLWGGEEHEAPFAVAVMRGGMPRDNDWAKRPDQPVLGVSTIDQVGSRLLFRGYGISGRSASIHAGLLGNDTLILLDEVHLATAFAETLGAIDGHYRKAEVTLPARSRVVQMSATPASQGMATPAFRLDEADRKHSILRQRLAAKKPARLEAIDVRGDNEAGKREAVAERAVTEALRLQREGAKVIALVVNRVDTARLAWTLLERHGEETARLLVTGRMRPIDRDRLVREQLLTKAGGDRVRGTDDAALVVVATQCIEAGADLDFDAMVTEHASLDALRQRFGRLDRRGQVTLERGAAPAVILARTDLTTRREDDPIYGEALQKTWTWLTDVAKKGVVGFGIDELAAQLPEGERILELLAPVAHAPVLLPAHLDAWVHTSPALRPSPEPEPALWLHGPQRSAAEVQVVWRADLEALNDDGELVPRDEAALARQLDLVRPSSLEAMTLPLHVVRSWLRGQADPRDMADVLAEAEPEEERGRRDRKTTQRKGAWISLRRDQVPRWRTFRDDEDEPHPRIDDEGEELRPGDLILVPTRYGGINGDGTFDPEAKSPVMDLGDVAQLRGRGQPTLRMERAALVCWGLPEETLRAVPMVQEENESAASLKGRVAEWAGGWSEAAPAGFVGTGAEWEVSKRALRKLRRKPESTDGKHFTIAEPRGAELWRADELADEVTDAITEDDDSSFRDRAMTLRQHSGDVRDVAEQFARRVGFDDQLVSDVALAGWLHDVGKKDPRFQCWLVGGDEVSASLLKEPLAKSALAPGSRAKREGARQRAGYPRGYRHELLSLAMIERSAAALAEAHDRELVLHLVASHHGWCRPFAPLLDDPDDLAVELAHGEVTLRGSTRHRAARLDSGVARRFWSLVGKYGWWGLAWLEAVLRLADHRASELGAAENDRAEAADVASEPPSEREEVAS